MFYLDFDRKTFYKVSKKLGPTSSDRTNVVFESDPVQLDVLTNRIKDECPDGFELGWPLGLIKELQAVSSESDQAALILEKMKEVIQRWQSEGCLGGEDTVPWINEDQLVLATDGKRKATQIKLPVKYF